MSEKTVRNYRDAGQLPSQIERPARSYRTRPDPLAEYWDAPSQIGSIVPSSSCPPRIGPLDRFRNE